MLVVWFFFFTVVRFFAMNAVIQLSGPTSFAKKLYPSGNAIGTAKGYHYNTN